MISAGLTASNYAAALVAGQTEAETEFRAQAVRWDGKQTEVRQALVLTGLQRLVAVVVGVCAILGGIGGFVTSFNNASVFLCARGIQWLTCPGEPLPTPASRAVDAPSAEIVGMARDELRETVELVRSADTMPWTDQLEMIHADNAFCYEREALPPAEAPSSGMLSIARWTGSTRF